MKVKKEKIVIGWREFVDLPDWKIKGLRVKIDTGAKSSSLHVEDVKELSHNRIEFYVVLNKSKARKKIIAKKIKQAHVKSSIGIKTARYYVETTLRLGNIVQKLPINLVGREGMNFRMLIGRNALKGKFIVDVNKSFLVAQPHKRRKANQKK